MKNYFIYRLVHVFHKFGFYYYSVKYYIEDNYEKKSTTFSNIINYIKVSFIAIIKMSKIFNYKNRYYEYLEIPITTKCSLKCKGCSNLMPCYDKPTDIDIDLLLKSIDSFLECINNIVYIRILGGEPFVCKNLNKVIERLLQSDKIQRIEIVTNGTIVPRDNNLTKLLTSKRINLNISKYPFVNIDKLLDYLNKNNIKYSIDEADFWFDYGKVEKKGRNKKQLIKQYRKCNSVCKSLLNGEVHICPRSSHGKDLGIIPVPDCDYLNLLDDNISLQEKINKLNKLMKKKTILACDYCDFGTKSVKKINVAEQVK